MLSLVQLQDFIIKIQPIETLCVLQQVFREAIKPTGLDKHSCVSLVNMTNPPFNAIQFFDFPEEWVNRYISKAYYKDDIVLKSILKNTGPYLWKNLDKSDKRNRQIYAEAKEFGIYDGMTVPFTLPGYYPGGINMAGEHVDISPDSYHVLHLMAEYYLWKIIELGQGNNYLPILPKLSPREIECLALMAKGKSDSMIGKILALSPRTVSSYMENIRTKYNVHTRTQAVAVAVFIGLIRP